jgi:hypothetical protein
MEQELSEYRKFIEETENIGIVKFDPNEVPSPLKTRLKFQRKIWPSACAATPPSCGPNTKPKKKNCES